MSAKERVVFLDRAAFSADELPIPDFDHNWSECPASDAPLEARVADATQTAGAG